MELTDELRELIQDAVTKRDGTWLFYAEGTVIHATLEMNNGEVLAPEPTIVLRLVTVTKTGGRMEPVESQYVTLRREDLTHLGNVIGQLLLTLELPEITEVHEAWSVDNKEPNGS